MAEVVFCNLHMTLDSATGGCEIHDAYKIYNSIIEKYHITYKVLSSTPKNVR